MPPQQYTNNKNTEWDWVCGAHSTEKVQQDQLFPEIKLEFLDYISRLTEIRNNMSPVAFTL